MQISEIFVSLQGEGKNQGRVCLFIRLAGCNLDCAWCDTKESRSGGISMSMDTILEQIWRVNPSYVCITGGEPLLQAEALVPLLASLSRRGAEIDIETNGTIDFLSLQQYASVCMDVKCPSSGEKSDLALLAKIRQQDTVKFVVKDENDCLYAQEIIASHKIVGEIFFSPVFGTDYKVISKFILTHGLPVRMQVQLHKVIGVK
jgi:7-carboxy-7-deazaguanine synthase